MSKKAEKARRRKTQLRRIIAVVKDTPCADCGKRYETRLMTFDHLPQYKKEGDINHFVRLKSRRRLFLEMAKCDIVCRPCHDTREINRGRMKPKVVAETEEDCYTKTLPSQSAKEA